MEQKTMLRYWKWSLQKDIKTIYNKYVKTLIRVKLT